jgi:hypothetical protein
MPQTEDLKKLMGNSRLFAAIRGFNFLSPFRFPNDEARRYR